MVKLKCGEILSYTSYMISKSPTINRVPFDFKQMILKICTVLLILTLAISLIL